MRTTTVLVMRHPWAPTYQSEQSGASPPFGGAARRWRGRRTSPAEADTLRFWLAVWLDAFRAALSLERWGLVRMEDLLLGGKAAFAPQNVRRQLRIHGSKVDPERAYAYANGTTFAAVDGAPFVRRTFGYDLATPAATPRHEGYWFSVGLDAQDRLPPAGLVTAWPSMRPAPPARTAYRVNCVACAEPHCLQKPARRRRPGSRSGPK